MEFLVHIEILWPPEAGEARREEIAIAEAKRAKTLAEEGIIRRLWRIPGRRANWGLWEAPDATTLHQAIASLPFFPWLSVEVHPLAVHPNDPSSTGSPRT